MQTNSGRQFLSIGGLSAALLLALTLGSWGASAQSIHDVVLDVYKSETCSCCSGWLEHMDQHNFSSNIFHPTDLDRVKEELGVKREWQSCHTAVTKEGYLFEGHIPAKFIAQFLASPPSGALGLAVPGMPMGTPGMDFGDQFTAYDIILMNKDGSSAVFASVKSKADQL